MGEDAVYEKNYYAVFGDYSDDNRFYLINEYGKILAIGTKEEMIKKCDWLCS
jgi:hypothetical protein